MNSVKYRSGIVIGALAGILLPYIFGWHNYSNLPVMFQIILPGFFLYIGGFLGKYVQKKYFSGHKDVR